VEIKNMGEGINGMVDTINQLEKENEDIPAERVLAMFEDEQKDLR
jgi:hypothetical protein